MKKELITIKATLQGYKLLRLISAETGEKLYEAMERVLQKEYDKFQNNSKQIKNKQNVP
jgi:hypothetical protein